MTITKKNLILSMIIGLTSLLFTLVSCKDDDMLCEEVTWYEDADNDGLGNPTVIQNACDQPERYVSNADDIDDTKGTASSLHAAFADFDSTNFVIYIEDNEVVIESNGMPNHTSPYWSNTTTRSAIDPMGNSLTTQAASENHPLFVEPTATSYESMAPGNIDDFNGSYTLRVPIAPTLATSTSSTGLGPIGMAVSGAMIYNDEEGPNVPLDNAVPSLDYTAAHTGPQSYHYHLEPKAWSDDDDVLIGIIADGFFLYGRKCYSTGTYPDDLDESGGHIAATQHNGNGEYHYHIQNEIFLNQYYLLFPDDYQGTPNSIQ
ncbi:YHYH protein [Membranihabitans marinus]|uniref:YHYH protein n=1 Tax=Membranihabitans marinus TaxID=1227546 RepID=UPI001F3946A5|nr:YHYH protein [Membranihabitans marinus]